MKQCKHCHGIIRKTLVFRWFLTHNSENPWNFPYDTNDRSVSCSKVVTLGGALDSFRKGVWWPEDQTLIKILELSAPLSNLRGAKRGVSLS